MHRTTSGEVVAAEPFVIAEAGSNHCGDLIRAKALISAARYAHADAVKFQACSIPYNWRDKGSRPAWIEVDFPFLEACADECSRVGIEFLVTPMYPEAVRALNPFVRRWKIASFDAGNRTLRAAVEATGKQVLVSTGYAPEGAPYGVPLLCVSRYPALAEDYGVVGWLRRVRPTGAWGISDHTVGFGAAACAVAHGASFVERHFALLNQPTSSPDAGPHALRGEALGRYVGMLHEVALARDGEVPEPVSRPGRFIWDVATGERLG